ncbi:hypothetical protein AcW1_008773 [Taiwanofungus camphoratus]|nr:hypothetical protein AcW1_008773 [Antrodia cinnamomea]
MRHRLSRAASYCLQARWRRVSGVHAVYIPRRLSRLVSSQGRVRKAACYCTLLRRGKLSQTGAWCPLPLPAVWARTQAWTLTRLLAAGIRGRPPSRALAENTMVVMLLASSRRRQAAFDSAIRN